MLSYRISWGGLSFALATLSLSAFADNEELKSPPVTVPDGFVVELVAKAPLVERPMLASFDDRGRLYVADSAGVNLRGDELSKNPPHSIRVLEDTDGDGIFDKSTVFADKMVFPQGILWHDGSVYVSSPPSFWRLQDTDGDGVCDKREELVTGFANTGVADDMHGASLGPDGRIYWFAGRFPHEIRKPGGPIIHKGTAPLMLRCKPDGTEVEVVCGTQGNPVGVAFTPEGEGFASGTFLASDSMGAGLRDAIIHCVDGAEYPVRDRILNEHKRTGDPLPPLTHLGVSASADIMTYRSETFGQEYRGNLFSCLFNMHKVMRHILERDGATFKCRNEDFAVSTHPDFHPTDVFEDADGSILVVDTGGWFRIGCPTSQIAKPQVKGAIYRIRRKGATPPNDPRGLLVKWDSLSAPEIAALLDDPRFAVRDRAVQQLATKGDQVVANMQDILRKNGSVQARQNLTWAINRIPGEPARRAAQRAMHVYDPRMLRVYHQGERFGDRDLHAIDVDDEPSVRQVVARCAGLHRDPAAVKQLSDSVRMDVPSVQREAATALGHIKSPLAVPALLDGLLVGGDRFLEHALIFALIEIADRDATLKGLQHTNSAVRRGALIALDQMEGGNLTSDTVLPYLDPADPVLQQTSLWVISHHSDWGKELVGFFRLWLAQDNPDENRREELKRQLLAFSKDGAVQDLVGQTLHAEKTPAPTRLLLLETIAQAPLNKLPSVWATEVRRSLQSSEETVVRQAVATVRAVPPDKRPVLTRVDPQVNFEQSEGKFAGTKLSAHFSVRWSGFIRVRSDGNCTFFTESDDGSRLFIDDRQIVNNGGFHATREKKGECELKAGDHEIRIEYFQGSGGAGCKASWSVDGTKEILPAQVLFHRPASDKGHAQIDLKPGLIGEYLDLGESPSDFPDLAINDFDGPLLQLAGETTRPPDLRVQALAAAAARLEKVAPELFKFLASCLDKQNPPLLRVTAAEALGHARLDESQLNHLTETVALAGALELPKLLPAYERADTESVGKKLITALDRSPGFISLKANALERTFKNYPPEIQREAEPLLKRLAVDTEKQKTRLTDLESVLKGGDYQRGRDLFFGNKTACSTCHTIQGQGGRVGPNLTHISAIRTGNDLLEAIVFPSASFARGFEPYQVTTRDGEAHSGVIGRETAEAIYLVSSATSEERILRPSIKELQQGTVSIMPEGLDVQLNRQELADLIGFLQSLR